MNKDLIAVFEYLEREKGIKREIVINAIIESLRTAARKSVKGLGEKVSIEIHPKTGEIEVYSQKKIVDKVTLPQDEISIEDAKKLEPECQIGQWLEIAVTPQDFGRIAAQAAAKSLRRSSKERNGMSFMKNTDTALAKSFPGL